MTATLTLPREFVWRRLHSLMGLWLVLFLIEHLLVNSQAALLLGDQARGFVNAVNAIHDFPYLPLIEFFLLGVPILVHLVWGIKYLLTSKPNAKKSDGTTPSLPEYGRNRAYTWQRITSWILAVGIIAHVTNFRFVEYPWSINQGKNSYFFVKVEMDKGLYTVADRLGVTLYNGAALEKEKQELEARKTEESLVDIGKNIQETSLYDAHQAIILNAAQKYAQKKEWVEALSKHKLEENEVVAVSPSFGLASLLTVRNEFKNPWMAGLYTVFVLAACFHAFNGLWTFLITWGIVLRMAAQKKAVRLAVTLMVLIAFLGLVAIWGTYWVNLKS